VAITQLDLATQVLTSLGTAASGEFTGRGFFLQNLDLFCLGEREELGVVDWGPLDFPSLVHAE
jgi:hypothetical protein